MFNIKHSAVFLCLGQYSGKFKQICDYSLFVQRSDVLESYPFALKRRDGFDLRRIIRFYANLWKLCPAQVHAGIKTAKIPNALKFIHAVQGNIFKVPTFRLLVSAV